MKSNYDACLAEALKHEGGWSDHPSDPGGATMKGVCTMTPSWWIIPAVMQKLDPANE